MVAISAESNIHREINKYFYISSIVNVPPVIVPLKSSPFRIKATFRQEERDREANHIIFWFHNVIFCMY